MLLSIVIRFSSVSSRKNAIGTSHFDNNTRHLQRIRSKNNQQLLTIIKWYNYVLKYKQTVNQRRCISLKVELDKSTLFDFFLLIFMSEESKDQGRAA